jgi:hypothetical protein
MMQHSAAKIDPPAHKSGFSVSGTASWLRYVAALLLAIFLISQTGIVTAAQSTPVASPVAVPTSGPGIEAAIDWLISQQDAGGGFIGFSGEPDPSLTIDAVLAIAAASGDHGESLAAARNYLMDVGQEFAESGPGQAAKLTLALVALGEDSAVFDTIAIITGSIPLSEDLEEGEIGYCGFGPFDHAICTLALAAMGEQLPAGFTDALRASQIENGGWAFDGSAEISMADSNTTGLVIQALIAAGVDASDGAIQAGLGYLATVIDPEQGGFAYDANSGLIADANSTAVVIQALIAAGEDASSDAWGRATAALAGFQNDSGAFRYQHEFPDDNLYATVQAIPAMAGTALPIKPN